MKSVGVFDILGPVMVGPSSSHTAGAARLGKVARAVAGGDIEEVTFYLHGSFAKTYKGHGTDRALVAGILGMEPSDLRLRDSLDIAKEMGLKIHFKEADLGDVHPNTVEFVIKGKEGTYAIPMESGLIGVYYNKDLFEKAGVKEFPETWTEFLDAIKKLKASGVIPIAMGTQTTYMAGHLHDQIFYKWLGTDAAKKLGSRDMKWTDPEVVETLQFVQDLIDAGAFDKNAAGMTDNIAMTQFQQGEAAMVITGPWNIGTFEDPAETPVCDSIEVAKFPYFEEKPEFKNEDMQTLSPYMISGKLEGKELELTLELVKMLTDKDAAKRFAEEAAFLIPRTDIDLDESAISPLFAKNVELGGTSEGIGVDVFDFDPLASMQDRTRNSISSMFTGEKPDSVAKEIQSEIDK